jgi:hypothetical protein
VITPDRCAFYIPANLRSVKLNLFNRIADHLARRGGVIVRGDPNALNALAKIGRAPIVGCSPELTDMIREWREANKPWVYWDRGYFLRCYATWLPRGENGGMYRWVVGRYQMGEVRDVPDDRWKAARIEVQPWQKNGRHIVIAAPTRTYARFHRTESWIADTIDALARVTDRQLVIRDKESKRPLQADLKDAHCLVTHGSIAAVESVICGCPVFVDQSSAAALVGQTDLAKIEKPVYPDRQKWLNSLAYSHFNEQEMVSGSLWRMLH